MKKDLFLNTIMICGLLSVGGFALLGVHAQDAQTPGEYTITTLSNIQEMMPLILADSKSVIELDPSLEPILDGLLSPSLDKMNNAIDSLKEYIIELEPEYQTQIDDYIQNNTPVDEALLAYQGIDRSATEPMYTMGIGGETMELIGKVFDGVGKVVGGFFSPAGGIIRGIGDVFKIIGQVTKQAAGANAAEQLLEKKIENLGKHVGNTLTGVPIPVKPGDSYIAPATPIDGKISETINRLQEIKQKLDNFGDRAGEVLIGRSIPIEPDTTFEKPKMTVQEEFALLREKIDNFASFYGRSIYGVPYDPEPTPTPRMGTTIERPATPTPLPPPLKEEMHGMEGDLDLILIILGDIVIDIDIVINKINIFLNFWDVYINETVKKIKHIFVYEEDIFVPTAQQPIRSVIVSTSAFALSGWIDLSRMGDNDQVHVDLSVSLDGGGTLTLWSHAEYTGKQTEGLKHFRDFARDVEEMAGTYVRIDITQMGSNIDGSLAIPYQFIVESTTERGPLAINTVIVTDNTNTLDDLSNNKDYDSDDDRELCVRWNLGKTDLKDFHVYVRDESSSGLTYLGRTASGLAEKFQWKKGSAYLANAFKDGPQFDKKYRFTVFGLTESGIPRVLGPYSTAGPVEFLER